MLVRYPARATPMNEHEAKLLKKLLRTRKAEAMSWLRGHSATSYRNLGEMEHEPSVALVRRLYDAGATKVLAVDIDQDSVGESSSDLMVELPEDADARERLFDLQREIVEPQGFEGDADEGEQYLYLKLC